MGKHELDSHISVKIPVVSFNSRVTLNKLVSNSDPSFPFGKTVIITYLSGLV